MTTGEAARSTQAVFEDHLSEAARADVERDIRRNYAPDVVLLTGVGVLRGHDGVRRSRELLQADAPEATFEYLTRLVEGQIAFLEWTGETDAVEISDGADSFLISDGLIRIQTIHYTVRHRAGYRHHVQHPGPGR
jgi:hypothetical protein